MISNYVQTNLSFCVFQIDTKDDRLFWESKIVSTLAKALDIKPTDKWLGTTTQCPCHHTSREKETFLKKNLRETWKEKKIYLLFFG